MGWPRSRDIASATMRVVTSRLPPGAKGTTILTGFAGNVCASAIPHSGISASRASNRFIVVSSSKLPVEPFAHAAAHDPLLVLRPEPWDLLVEHGVGLAIGARKPRAIGTPEDATRPQPTLNWQDDGVGLAVGEPLGRAGSIGVEAAHDREAAGVRLRRCEPEVVAIPLPRGRHEHGPLHARGVHLAQQLLGAQRRVAMRVRPGGP